MRYAFGDFLAQTVPVQVVSRLMGHRNVRTTERYFKVRDQAVRDAAKRAYATPRPWLMGRGVEERVESEMEEGRMLRLVK